MLELTPPPKENQSPYVPAGPSPLVCETFKGVFTLATRAGVPDERMFWCDGFMPVAPRNLRTLYGKGALLYTAPSTIKWMDSISINSIPYLILTLANGAVWSVRTDTSATLQVLANGTVSVPSRDNQDVAQWGNQYLIYVSSQSNGYWLWNGSLLFTAGTLPPTLELDYTGSSYTSAPSITVYGGSGSGATVTASVASGIVTGITVTNPGSGYLANEVVGLAFESGQSASARTAIIVVSVNAGGLSLATVVNGGNGYGSTGTLSDIVVEVAGGGGTGGLISVSGISGSGGSITSVSVTSGGIGYSSPPAVLVTDVRNPVARAHGDVMPFGISGSCVETYSGRVWVGSGPTIFFSAPGSFFDFSVGIGGGSFTSSDSFLKNKFVRLRQTNGFLYLIADSSTNYISGVQVSGVPPVTTFNNQNADPEVGTVLPGTVLTFGRKILFGNVFGVQQIVGSAVSKVSAELDGMYTSGSVAGVQPSAAKMVIFGRPVWMMLWPYVDPRSAANVTKLLMWDGQVWWASGQDMTLTYVCAQEINSGLFAWGTDGTNVYPLFQASTTGFTKFMVTKLWDSPGGIWETKAAGRFWSLMQYYDSASPLIFSVDNDVFSSGTNYTISTPVSTGIYASPPQAIGQTGQVLGLTFQTVSKDMSIISTMIEAEMVQYRG